MDDTIRGFVFGEGESGMCVQGEQLQCTSCLAKRCKFFMKFLGCIHSSHQH